MKAFPIDGSHELLSEQVSCRISLNVHLFRHTPSIAAYVLKVCVTSDACYDWYCGCNFMTVIII
jgi:hypothetical protein